MKLQEKTEVPDELYPLPTRKLGQRRRDLAPEISAAFGLVQLDKLAGNIERRQRNFEITSSYFARWPELFSRMEPSGASS